MNYKNTIHKLGTSLVMATALTLVATPLFARVDLVAIEGRWTPQAAGAQPIPMWGFARDTGQACDSLPDWTVGPELSDSNTPTDLQANGNLRIRLRNCLSEPVSVIIPGQKAIPVLGVAPQPARNADGRITSFSATTPPDGSTTVDYLWQNVAGNPGTFLYMSGSHPALQVHMGLYGALKVGSYDPGIVGADVTLLYSEIDPLLHNSATVATPLTYKPRYYLVNGQEQVLSIPAGSTGLSTVLSFLNAGLDFHVPTFAGGEYMSLEAEDGNSYPFAKEQYSVNLAAGKTIEALWQPTTEGDHIIYDRRGNGMITKLTVGAGAGGGPVAAADGYSVNEDTPLSVTADIGVLFNDTGLPASPQVELVTGTSAGTLSCSTGGLLCADGSFSYTPNLNFNGADSFTYKTVAVDGIPSSNTATVTITVNPVNDPPIAIDDAYDAVSGVELTVAAPGVLGNDQDIDGDTLTVIAGPVNSDGSFVFTPTVASGTETINYTVSDGAGGTASATVTFTAANDIPVANDDVAYVQRNSGAGDTRNTFSLTANDTDANGIDVASVVVSGTTRGGTVVANSDGTVTYTPPRRWRGTDTFTYTVKDTLGEISNVATVRVNVVRARDLPPLP